MIDVILKLTFIDDVVDLLSYTLDAAIVTDLANNELVVFALAELEGLVNGLVGVSDDVLKSKRAKFTPFLLDSLESDTGSFLVFTIWGFVSN